MACSAIGRPDVGVTILYNIQKSWFADHLRPAPKSWDLVSRNVQKRPFKIIEFSKIKSAKRVQALSVIIRYLAKQWERQGVIIHLPHENTDLGKQGMEGLINAILDANTLRAIDMGLAAVESALKTTAKWHSEQAMLRRDTLRKVRVAQLTESSLQHHNFLPSVYGQ